MASCKLMQTVCYSISQPRRSWRFSSPKFNIKFFTVLAFLAYLLIFNPASALFLFHCPSEQTSDPILHFNLLGRKIHFKFKYYSHGGGRRILLQDGGRFNRPSPTGYPPPADNQQVIPRAPSDDPP